MLMSNNCYLMSFNVYTKLSLNDTEISLSLELLSFLGKLSFLPFVHHLCRNVWESECLENSHSVVQIFL